MHERQTLIFFSLLKWSGAFFFVSIDLISYQFRQSTATVSLLTASSASIESTRHTNPFIHANTVDRHLPRNPKESIIVASR